MIVAFGSTRSFPSQPFLSFMLSDGVWACVCVGWSWEKKWFGGDAVGGGEIGYDAAKKYQEIVGALDGGSRKRTQPCRGIMYVYM